MLCCLFFVVIWHFYLFEFILLWLTCCDLLRRMILGDVTERRVRASLRNRMSVPPGVCHQVSQALWIWEPTDATGHPVWTSEPSIQYPSGSQCNWRLIHRQGYQDRRRIRTPMMSFDECDSPIAPWCQKELIACVDVGGWDPLKMSAATAQRGFPVTGLASEIRNRVWTPATVYLLRAEQNCRLVSAPFRGTGTRSCRGELGSTLLVQQLAREQARTRLVTPRRWRKGGTFALSK